MTKRLLFCLTLLSLLIAGTLGAYKIIEVPEAVARMQVVVAGGGSTSQAPAWFGETNDSAPTFSFYNGDISIYNVNKTYACPGSGSRHVTKLMAFLRSNDPDYNKFRLAIYSTSGDLVCQGTAIVRGDVDYVAKWEGHTTSSLIQDSSATAGNCYITGGTSYRFAISRSLHEWQSYNAGASGDTTYNTTTDKYTGGFDATQPAGSDDNVVSLIKAYVE